MTELCQGILYVKQFKGGSQSFARFKNAAGKSYDMRVAEAQLAQTLRAHKTGEIEIDLEFENGQVLRARCRGESSTASSSDTPPHQRSRPPEQAGHPRAARETANGPRDQGGRNNAQAAPVPAGNFHNPYGHVPALPLPDPQPGGLGQNRPAGRHRWHRDLYSGRIDIEIETVTPLLLPDPARLRTKPSTGNKLHEIFPVRLRNGHPWLAPTSFKGALRAAYEAVTNSRLGIFKGHDAVLGRRMSPAEGLGLVPARVLSRDRVRLLLGTNRGLPGSDGPPGKLMYAAWLRRYGGKPQCLAGTKKTPAHRTEVTCTLQKMRHESPEFFFWQVIKIEDGHKALTHVGWTEEDEHNAPRAGERHRPIDEWIVVHGWTCITGQNIDRKHDERVFFDPPGVASVDKTIDERIRLRWRLLLDDYDRANQQEIQRRDERNESLDAFFPRQPPHAPAVRPALGRHIDCDRRSGVPADLKSLPDGTLCYAKVDATGNVVGLYPVMIARELAAVTPAELLPSELHPANSLADLSPADRVFGWVCQSGGGRWPGAWKGQLRIRNMHYKEQAEGLEPIEKFAGDGLPLAILSSPKPQQARFYLGRATRQPLAQDRQLTKAGAFYAAGKGLRGRKIYPHHVIPQAVRGAYWNGQQAAADREQEPQLLAPGFYREYRRRPLAGNDQDDQNYSILGWVRPKTRFACTIEVTNLSREELGALLWLLDLDKVSEDTSHKDRHLRLGGAKPLGFGSAKVKVTAIAIETGAERCTRYRSLLAAPTAAKVEDPALRKAVDDHVDIYRKSIVDAYAPSGRRFNDVPFIAAFLRAAEGHHHTGLPTYYPRVTPAPSPNGENFKWFVNNDKERITRTGPTVDHGYVLLDLWHDRGLPLLL